MSNEFRGTGNLGDNPTLKTVLVKGEDRKVAEIRVFFDEYKPDGQGGFEQSGGFWMNASVWDKRGEDVAQHLRKGARVHVTGRLAEQEWTDKESGEVRKTMQLNADDVYLSLSRLEDVKFRPKAQEVGA
ncbi:MAG: single-stranded DNA-binding protein [Thiobacillus sp.]|nr:single-stranded DNA-binding protein [Thiobacillus sp.]